MAFVRAMVCRGTRRNEVHRRSMALTSPSTIEETFIREAEELRWLAAVILGSDRHVEDCITDAIQLAESGGMYLLRRCGFSAQQRGPLPKECDRRYKSAPRIISEPYTRTLRSPRSVRRISVLCVQSQSRGSARTVAHWNVGRFNPRVQRIAVSQASIARSRRKPATETFLRESTA